MKISRSKTKRPRKLGLYKGKIWIAEDFDAPLPPEILNAFIEAPITSKKKRSNEE
jgi:hypothetical protein